MNLMHLFGFATSLYHPFGHWVSKNFVGGNVVQKFFMKEEILKRIVEFWDECVWPTGL